VAWQVTQKAEDEAEKAKEAEAQAKARVGEVENALQHQEKLHRKELDALRASHLVQLKEVRDGEFPDRPLGLIAFLVSRHLTLGCLRSQG
jgi:DNA-binding protein H-NS